MKNGKKFLSLLLVMCLVVGLSNNLTLAAPTVGDLSGGKRKVTFQYTDASAASVYVAGNFNGWSKDSADWKMTKTSGRTWELTKEMTEGVYEYKFVVDGTWTKDPKNNFTTSDSYQNSMLVVPGVVTSPVVNGNSVTFNYPVSKLPSGTTAVRVKGNFNAWKEENMSLNTDGTHYTCTIINLAPGVYEYGFNIYIGTSGTYYRDFYNMETSVSGANSVFTVDSYTVSFNANGGGGSMAMISNTVGNYELPNNTFVAPTNKRFKGWSDTSDGSGTIYNPGSTYYVNKDTILYAIWEDDPASLKYTISFNANGGTGTMSNDDVIAGNYKIPSCTFNPPVGKKFKEWAKDSVSGTKYNVDSDYGVSADTTFYAIWEDITHTVTFNGNGGTGSMGNATANEGSYTLPANTFTPQTGKQFKGWSETIDGSGTVYNQGAAFNLTKDTTLYAIWENDPSTTFQVSFNANGGSGSMVPVDENGPYTLPSNGFTPPTGKRFKTWAMGSATGTQYDVGDSLNVTENVTFYAVWEDITYTVSYDNNGGSGSMSGVTANVAGYTTPNNTFTPPYGKQFKGWSETSNGLGTVYNQGVAVTLTKDTTLYAIWEDEPALNRTISFNANGGNGAMSNVDVISGSNYKLPSNGFTAPDGYKFKAWAEGSDTGTLYNEGYGYSVSEDKTFYAIWEKLSTPSERKEFISNTELTEVPEGLKSTNFNTIEKIENELIRVVTQNSEYTVANTTISDVKMQISLNGGTTWVGATEDDFPTEGITVKLPYPQGTGKDSHDFAVTHMFTVTSARLGTVAGETETPEVTKLDDGIQVTLKGLSPVVIAWKPVTTTPSDSETSEETKTPDNTTPSDSGTSEETKAPDNTTTSDSETSEEAKTPADTTNSNVLETQSDLANLAEQTDSDDSKESQTSTGSDKAKDVESNNSIDVLETGDNRIISLYIGTMIASLIGFISIVTIRKKKRDKKDLTK